MATITFRGKVETPQFIDGTPAPSRIKVPELTRRHCDMDAFRAHPKFRAYANSDMFPSMLARIRRERLGEYLRLDQVPDGVHVDCSGFLAVVSIDV